jgi:hypothetical protein
MHRGAGESDQVKPAIAEAEKLISASITDEETRDAFRNAAEAKLVPAEG